MLFCEASSISGDTGTMPGGSYATVADAGYSRVEAAVAATAVKDCFGVGTGRSAVRGTNAKEKVLKRPVRNSILWVSNDAEIADIVHIGARRREHPGSK